MKLNVFFIFTLGWDICLIVDKYVVNDMVKYWACVIDFDMDIWESKYYFSM